MSLNPHLLAVLLPLALGAACGKKQTQQANTVASSNKTVDLAFSGEGFTPHEGQTITLALVTATERRRVELKSQIVNGGKFRFDLKGIIDTSQSYFLDYYADANGNGQCDSAPTDHVWRVEINPESSPETTVDPIAVTEEHHMNFLAHCKSFGPNDLSPTGTKTHAVVGSLKLDSSVSVQGFEPGQALSDGQVFFEGFPDQAIRSNSSGQFVLNISLDPSDSGLHGGQFITQQTPQKLRLFMWYSKKSSQNRQKSWSLSEVKFGTAQDLTLTTPTLDIGTQSLTYTKGVKLTTIDQSTKKFVSNCWIFSPSFQSKLPVVTDPKEFHRIDYLPEGTYEFQIRCVGYKLKTTKITVSKASSSSEPWDSPPPVELAPDTP